MTSPQGFISVLAYFQTHQHFARVALLPVLAWVAVRCCVVILVEKNDNSSMHTCIAWLFMLLHGDE